MSRVGTSRPTTRMAAGRPPEPSQATVTSAASLMRYPKVGNISRKMSPPGAPRGRATSMSMMLPP